MGLANSPSLRCKEPVSQLLRADLQNNDLIMRSNVLNDDDVVVFVCRFETQDGPVPGCISRCLIKGLSEDNFSIALQEISGTRFL